MIQPGAGLRPGPRRALTLAAAVLALLIAAPMLWHTLHTVHRLVDLEVYRGAADAVRSGDAVYDHTSPPPENLPFTYPPLAALLALPLTLLSFRAAGLAWTAMNLGLLAFLLWRYARPLWSQLGPALGPLVFAGAAWLLPVRDTFRFGQVNLILLTLVLLDCTSARPRWPRGALVGVATAIKLTPGLFIPYLWVSGRRRAAYVAAGTASALTLLTFAVLPRDSRDFWFDALLNSDRLGSNSGTSNQAIRGVVLRFLGPGLPTTLLVLTLVAVAAYVGLRRAASLSRGGAEISALTVVGCTAVLVSPVSWIHHMVWVLLAIVVLCADLRDRRRVLAAGALAVLSTLQLPWWGAGLARWLPDGLVWSGRIVQATLCLVAVAIVGWLPAPRSGQESVGKLGRSPDSGERGIPARALPRHTGAPAARRQRSQTRPAG